MNRIFIDVPYKENSQVKALGALWDGQKRSMYIPPGVDVAPFGPWLKGVQVVAGVPVALAAPIAPIVLAVAKAPRASVALAALAAVVDEEIESPSISESGPGEGADNQTPLFPLNSSEPAAPSAPVTDALSIKHVPAVPKGITLFNLLAGVANAVAAAYRIGIWTTVEVTAVNSRSGHFYLELSERDVNGSLVAKANGTIWAATAKKVLPDFERATGARLAPGIKLLVRAKPVYKAQFGFSLDIDAIDSDYTLGDLEAKKRDIRSRLTQEGIFNSQQRLAAPWDFNCALVISPDAAAGLGDFQAQSNRLAQFGVCQFIYAQSRFQGEGAAGEIADVLQSSLANWAKLEGSTGAAPDVVVIIRGGGAVNDLAWLNDYKLCKAICGCPVPVFTGIGHERDLTLIDEVAYAKFDTPSKVIAFIEKLIVKRAQTAVDAFQSISHIARLSAQKNRATVEGFNIAARAGASRQVELARMRTADLVKNVRQGSTAQIALGRTLSKTNIDFVAERAVSHVLRVRVQVTASFEVMQLGARQIFREARGRTKGLIREIIGQGPEKTLVRGFSVVRNTNGKPVTRAGQMEVGHDLSIQFLDGSLQAHVVAFTPNPVAPLSAQEPGGHDSHEERETPLA